MRNKIIPVSSPLITLKDAQSVFKTVRSGWVSSAGKEIKKFEKKFASLNNRKFACTVANGTAALEIAVKSLNLKKNDEIIMPAFTIISNAIAIIKNNAKPVLIDSNLDNWNINIKDIQKKISKRTKAIMVPHIYGFPCEMDKLKKLCNQNQLYLIEDAAEMIGQTYMDRPCGSFGDISTFSFYANKHITTGEGGMILTNKKYLNERFNDLKNLSFGKNERFLHTDISWNYRFTNIQASLGLSQLRRLKSIVKKKREIGNFYYEKFKDNKKIIIQPKKMSYAKNIYWVFGLILKENNKKRREKIQKNLLKYKIETRPFFCPMHKQKIFHGLGLFKKQKFPISEYMYNSGFYIPAGLNLNKTTQSYIADRVNKVINSEY